jgi:trehalose synthase
MLGKDVPRHGTVFAAQPRVFEVQVSARALSPFVALVGHERVENVAAHARRTFARLAGHTVWNISSTAVGGGVSEVIRSLLRYARGLGVDVRWLVVEGPHAFFTITKRLHNALHDEAGDGSPLGSAQAALYEQVLSENLAALTQRIRPGDAVICHDPQTAGMIPTLKTHGAKIVWRCHIGRDGTGVQTELGWRFLEPYLRETDITVFSRSEYLPSWMTGTRVLTLAPHIDPFSVKNQWLPVLSGQAILEASGLVEPSGDLEAPVFVREDGTLGRVTHPAHLVREYGALPLATPCIVQISRWDRMKGHGVVLDAFRRLVEATPSLPASLVLAGPSVASISDDPDGPQVFSEIKKAWRALPDRVRARSHLAEIPMLDVEENASIINALQRHATVIVQASLREGFGLTVTEAMWKRKPIVASEVGGIRDQVRNDREGLLVKDPTDAQGFAEAFRQMLASPELRTRLGQAAYERACERYLSLTALDRWGDLLDVLYA